MANLFSSADLAILRTPHVGQSIHVDIDHPTLGMLRFHGGVGEVTANGQTWKGVSSPDGRQMVEVGAIHDQRLGQAAVVGIVLSGAQPSFLAEMRSTARTLEGRAANVYFALFKAGTMDVVMWKKVMAGRMTAPTIVEVAKKGGGVQRAIQIAIEGEDQAKNFSTAEKWSPAGIRKRFGADVKGLDFMGVDIKEIRP